jgi:hypothetical protein
MNQDKMDISRPISIHFHPFKFEKKEHAIEKADGGLKRKYLKGISSGIMKDGHGERMTLNCIESMMNQGKSGNVMLYAGMHGINFINDLGILVDSEIVEKRDWLTTYRLYDEYDKMPKTTIEEADKLWKQCRGLPPYRRPIQKGFSIEGVVPEDAIIDKVIEDDGRWTHRVINDMILDGVIVCNRPAYQDSIVTAVYKCLKELPPTATQRLKNNIKNELAKKIQKNNDTTNFYQTYFEVNSVLEDKIYEIMKMNDDRGAYRLDILLDEYKEIMKSLILQNADIFHDEIAKSDNNQSSEKAQLLLKQLVSTARLFSNSIIKRIGG